MFELRLLGLPKFRFELVCYLVIILIGCKGGLGKLNFCLCFSWYIHIYIVKEIDYYIITMCIKATRPPKVRF